MVVSDNTLNLSGRRWLIMYRESRPLTSLLDPGNSRRLDMYLTPCYVCTVESESQQQLSNQEDVQHTQ